jgi:hypothetical protein
MLGAPSAGARPSAERVSVLLSSTALALAVIALFVALDSPRSAPALLDTASLHARLHELSIYRDNIAAGAVGTDELGDGAVITQKLARGSVTMDALSQEAVAGLTASVTAAIGGKRKQLVGEVDESGSVVQGRGFTSSRTAEGEYQISFATAFAAPPVVVAVAQSYGTCYLPAQTISASSVRIKCMSELLTSSPQPANTRFSFVATPAF